MPFFDHLDELRVRVTRCLLVFFLGFILVYFTAAEQILGFLREPLFKVLAPDQRKLYFTSLFENFLTHLKISGYGAVFIFSPYFFYELWKFIAPGLYERERKMVVPFISAASAFFVGGAAFAYYVLFPVGFQYFVSYGAATDVPLITIDSYYGTVLKLLLLFGLAFELPVLITLLGYLGVIDAAFLRKHRRNAIMGITVVSALFAPPDAISMLILGIPLVILYEGSIWVVQWLGVRRKRVSDSGVPAPLTGQSRPPEL